MFYVVLSGSHERKAKIGKKRSRPREVGICYERLTSYYIIDTFSSTQLVRKKENHQQENIILINYQILRTEIKRKCIAVNYENCYVYNKGIVNSICPFNASPVYGNNLPAKILKLHLSIVRSDMLLLITFVYFSLEFEIPMHICSGLQIRYLRVQDREKTYSPFRWVRYITHR